MSPFAGKVAACFAATRSGARRKDHARPMMRLVNFIDPSSSAVEWTVWPFTTLEDHFQANKGAIALLIGRRALPRERREPAMLIAVPSTVRTVLAAVDSIGTDYAPPAEFDRRWEAVKNWSAFRLTTHPNRAH